ncbi:MAG: protease [Mucilaginibacter sp.]
MKNILLLSAALLTLASCGVNNKGNTSGTDTTGTDTAAPKILTAKMYIKDTIKVGEPVTLKFTVYNTADTAMKFCKWHTPFEAPMSKYLDIKNEAGEEVNYKGAMAKRIMPPPADSYLELRATDSVSANTDLLRSYAIEKPARYTIVYNSKDISGLTVTDSVSFVYIK